MKRGFSMIELIFVIVILGILASVALPKLAATRDDATASGIKTDVGTITQAVPALYMSQKVASIVQSVPALNKSSWDIVSDMQIQSVLMTQTGGGTRCIRIVIAGDDDNTTEWVSTGSQEPVLALIMGTGARNGACDTIYNMGIRDQNISLKGLSIAW